MKMLLFFGRYGNLSAEFTCPNTDTRKNGNTSSLFQALTWPAARTKTAMYVFPFLPLAGSCSAPHTHTHAHTLAHGPSDEERVWPESVEQWPTARHYEILRIFLPKNIKFNTFCTYCWLLSYKVNTVANCPCKCWLSLNAAPSRFILLKVLFQSETLQWRGHSVCDSRGRKKEALLIGWYSWTSLFPAEVYVPDTRW